MADKQTGSANSVWSDSIRSNCHLKWNSQPFDKPNLSERQGFKVPLKEKVFHILSRIKGSNHTETKPEDFSLDESKMVIRELSNELDRVLKTKKLSLLKKVLKDEACKEDREGFILQWAEDLTRSTTQREACSGKFTSSATDELKPEEARKVLSDWAWSLKNMRQESVDLDEDGTEVLQDLEKLWKKGKLPHLLQVMDFIIWSLLQKNTQEDSSPKKWIRNRHRSRTRRTLNRIPDSVWKWVSSAKDEVTLDPSTANPCLKLSRDRKAVRMDQIIESKYNPWEDFRRSKETYDGWWCVLGSEGFDSGRHYWEVDLKDMREWRVGVVQEFAPRNGFETLNTRAGYWTLRLQLGNLLAMTSPAQKLDRDVPSRLGVFLDFEEGQVSFYNVEQRCHIYTFEVNFAHVGKIYPVFGTTETDKDLVIL